MGGRAGSAVAALVTLVTVTAAGLLGAGGHDRPHTHATVGAGGAAAASEPGAPEIVAEPATRLPGGVSIPFEAGRSTWSVVSNGIALEVRLEPARPVVGQPVRFSVAAAAGVGCCWLGLSFGDGASAGADDGRGCDSSTTRQAVARHAYPRAGQWTFTLTTAAGDCTGVATSGALSGVVEVVDNPGRALL